MPTPVTTTIIKGDTQHAKGRYAIVVSRYNESITQKLLTGAQETLASREIPPESISVVWVPGAWEIPLIAKILAQSDSYAAILCLGCVIRGETTHDQHINQQVSRSLGQLSVEYQVPVAFGLLTCNTLEQAIHRSGGNVGNKGIECAEAALEMVSIVQQLQS